MKIITAATARDVAMSAKLSDISLECAYDKIYKRAKLGFMDADVSVDKEHINDVYFQLSKDGYKVHISQEGVYYNTLHIDWR